MRRASFLPLALLLLVAACKENRPDWARQDAPGAALPAESCAQVRKALEGLRSARADYTGQGEATLPREAWLQMSGTQRDQLVKTLAYHAACVAGETNEAQTVVIHSDDGDELLRRTLSTELDMSELLRGE